MVDVVRAKTGSDELLEQVRFLVRSLGRAKPRQRPRTPHIANGAQRAAGHLERLLPARFAKHRQRIVRVHHEIGGFGYPRLPDQRLGQPLAVMNVVEAEAPLDAKALAIGHAVASFDADDAIVGDVVGELAANAAIGTHRRDGLVHRDQIGVVRRRKRTGGTGLHAFATRDAGRYTHRVGKIEYDLRARAAKRIADDVVDLFFAAGAHASRALDAGIEIDCHRRMREVGWRLRARLEARHTDLQPSLPVIELRVELVNPLRHIRGQHFDH